jgi:hypothetical protein
MKERSNKIDILCASKSDHVVVHCFCMAHALKHSSACSIRIQAEKAPPPLEALAGGKKTHNELSSRNKVRENG